MSEQIWLRTTYSREPFPDALIADKGYDSDALVENLEARGIAPIIPPKANRKHQCTTDFALYRERILVDRFFCTLQHFRAVATRYDKLANTFLAGVPLVCVLMRFNRRQAPEGRVVDFT
jgi:transposase